MGQPQVPLLLMASPVSRPPPPAFRPPALLPAMDPSSTSSPALSVALAVLAVLLSLTGFGVYQAFGPPSKALSDPFDDHDD